MGKKTPFICQSCHESFPKWFGKCPNCNAWHSIHENKSESSNSKTGANFQLTALGNLDSEANTSFSSGFIELDRALGGGIVPGSVSLIGGEPGIGKSTLMLQMAAALTKKKLTTLYFTAEESLTQLKRRAERCGITSDSLLVSNGSTLEYVRTMVETHHPKVLICDSIQVMSSTNLSGIAGSITQLREVSAELIQLAKTKQMALFLVGHITKDGQIAGPKLLEHAVDTVLYFEHTHSDQIRVLRAHKNRFGPTFEVGIFEMQGQGLKDATDASTLFVHPYEHPRIGSVFYPSIQGSRPLISEVQALCSPCQFGAPRRQGLGTDNSRVALLAAIIEKHVGLKLSSQDIFVNIVGGVVDKDPALDLAVALSLISSFMQRSLPKDIVVCGECGLSGEVRRAAQLSARLKEARALALSPILIPHAQLKENPAKGTLGIRHVSELLGFLEAPKKTLRSAASKRI